MQALQATIEAVRARIAEALARVDDATRSVVIVGVTKKHPAAVVEALAAAGIRDIGENRVQEALLKAPAVAADVRWHLIGSLQRNKARRAAELFKTIHSVDSPRLLEALGAAERPLEIFLQVNVSGEEAKGGVSAGDLQALHQAALGHPQLRVAGLMGMAAWAPDAEASRPAFRTLRELRDELNRSGDGPPLPYLSMGMSGDFEVALEEGATHLRLGTVLTGPRPGQHKGT